ncbi:MAG: hypothetical protein IT443_05735 [Phycisphaeraceae bacterium]|nr:hypothetical protein [Phycisphaeraceae bacterium]
MLAQSLLWFAQGVWLVLGLLLWLALAFISALLIWVLCRYLIASVRIRAAWQAAAAARRRADGSLYPPTDEALCDRCTRVFVDVHILPDGRRLCRTCYDQVIPLNEPNRPAPAPSPDTAVEAKSAPAMATPTNPSNCREPV